MEQRPGKSCTLALSLSLALMLAAMWNLFAFAAVLDLYWRWFVVNLWSVPVLSYGQAFAIVLLSALVVAFVNHYREMTWDDVTYTVMAPITSFVVGLIVHLVWVVAR